MILLPVVLIAVVLVTTVLLAVIPVTTVMTVHGVS